MAARTAPDLPQSGSRFPIPGRILAIGLHLLLHNHLSVVYNLTYVGGVVGSYHHRAFAT
jgi:hypothetical protein